MNAAASANAAVNIASASLAARIIDRQIDILTQHATTLVARVQAGQLGFIDAVDIAYEAAIAAGMGETIGDDAVQEILHQCFGPARPTVGQS
jgi:hypothetical protein